MATNSEEQTGQILNQDDLHFDSGGIDFSAIWAAVYRSRFSILAILATCFVIGIVTTLLTTKIYQASATVQIDQEAKKVVGTEQTDLSASIQDSDRFLQTQLDVIRSRALAITVAEDEKLFGTKNFIEAMKIDPEVKAVRWINRKQAERDLVINALTDNLSVSLPIDSRVSRISFQSPDPTLAARISNSFAENYIRNNLQRKFDTSSYAREFLKKQLDEAAERLSESEQKTLEYARQTRIIDTSNASDTKDSKRGPTSLVTASLVQLNQEYSAAVARRFQSQNKWETASRGPTLAIPDVLNNLAVQNLIEERAKRQAELQDELQRRKGEHPNVLRLATRVNELNRQIAGIGSTIRQSIRGEYETALAQERALVLKINTLKNDTLDEQSQSVQLGILQRNAGTNRELYDLLLNRYNELNAEAGAQSNNAAIVDRAIIPLDPIAPNIPLNLALSILAGLGLAGLFVFIREQVFDTIRVPDDIIRKLKLPVLGVIPVLKDGTLIEQICDSKSLISEAYSSLRTSLLLSSAEGLPKSMMFTSSRQGEGKSSTCFATALALSRIGKKVVIVDLDLRRPNQHNLLELTSSNGASDILSNNAEVGTVIQATKYPGISFIDSGNIPPNPSELIAGAHTSEMFAKLADQFDTVLIDVPPLLGLADAVIVAAFAEKIVFVVESNRNQAVVVRNSVGRLSDYRSKLAGILLTKFDAKSTGYYSEHRYDYEYEYKYK